MISSVVVCSTLLIKLKTANVRYYPILILLALAAGLGACSSAKKLSTSTGATGPLSLPDSLPPLPQSEIDLPVKIAPPGNGHEWR